MILMYLVANANFVIAVFAKDGDGFKLFAFYAIFFILSAIYWSSKNRKED